MAVYENKCVLTNKLETFQTESLGLCISRVILKCLIQFAATQKYRQANEYKYNEEGTLRVNYLTGLQFERICKNQEYTITHLLYDWKI